ncbi:MAG: hypothetical protein KC549_07110, partial [Myxococcales bacterium]|nr:hypothetical protein [Myxococcales bacterium]
MGGPAGDLSGRVAHLERLVAAHRRLLAEEEPERLLEVALEALIGFLDADRGFALLREADGRPRLR